MISKTALNHFYGKLDMRYPYKQSKKEGEGAREMMVYSKTGCVRCSDTCTCNM